MGLDSDQLRRILIDGNVINELAPGRAIAVVFQNYALDPHMRGLPQMAFGLKSANSKSPRYKRRGGGKAGRHPRGIGELLPAKPRQLLRRTAPARGLRRAIVQPRPRCSC